MTRWQLIESYDIIQFRFVKASVGSWSLRASWSGRGQPFWGPSFM